EFGTFTHIEEGENAETDVSFETYIKFIEHVQFMKEFVVSAQMMEDSNFGLATDAKRRAESFTRAYYRTMNKLCETALINGTEYTASFNNATIDTTSPDRYPLFCKDHIYGMNYHQSNYYGGDLVCTGSGSSRVYSAEKFAESLAKLGILFRNMKDESGEALGYTADTIIIPANRPELESIVRKTCASYGAVGTANNDINIHYGNWNLVILPSWQSDIDSVMLMSSEANKNLGGNLFFNRVPLTVSNWVDNHSGNYIWNGRCRFGIGFGSYKHIMRIDDVESDDIGENRTAF
ncbi:MAG: hypothetical protein IJW03_04240, partial [Clostridia bacterium]|nr:hypothetical protein [Clostridia bacterium]